jgi:hypothetical protein
MKHTSEDQDRLKTVPNGQRRSSDRRGDDHDRQTDRPEPSPTVRRMTVAEAAEILGITTDAVRSRMRRGKLRREEGEYGTVYVLLDAKDGHDGQDGHPTAEDGHGTGTPTGGNSRETVEHTPLVGELRERVRSLETQLDHERQANRENRRLLAAALERIPAIEAGDEQESPVTATEGTDRGKEAPPEQQEDAERRSWLYRFFFGP